MTDFNLAKEERTVQQFAHDFAEKEIRPKAAYCDEREEFPYAPPASAKALSGRTWVPGRAATARLTLA